MGLIMYTKLDDKRHAKKINEYIMRHPHATKKEIMVNVFTNHHRIKYLQQEGLVHEINK
jgi:hypothetical protein